MGPPQKTLISPEEPQGPCLSFLSVFLKGFIYLVLERREGRKRNIDAQEIDRSMG